MIGHESHLTFSAPIIAHEDYMQWLEDIRARKKDELVQRFEECRYLADDMIEEFIFANDEADAETGYYLDRYGWDLSDAELQDAWENWLIEEADSHQDDHELLEAMHLAINLSADFTQIQYIKDYYQDWLANC